MCALEAVSPCPDESVFHSDVGAHRPESLHVQIDRPRSDSTTTRQRHVGLTESADQRPEHQDRCPHRFDELVRRTAFTDIAAVHFNIEFVINGDHSAHTLQERNNRGYVIQMGHITYGHCIRCEQGASQNRQSCVFRTRYRNLSFEPGASVYE